MTHPYRYALTVEYDGGLFSGWQRQDTAPSVQHGVEQAIQSLTQQSVCVYGAGRTDAGVHAARWLVLTCPRHGLHTRCAKGEGVHR